MEIIPIKHSDFMVTDSNRATITNVTYEPGRSFSWWRWLVDKSNGYGRPGWRVQKNLYVVTVGWEWKP